MLGRRKRIRTNRVDSLIGANTEVSGDLRVAGDLVILGTVFGNVLADDGTSAVVNLSDTGRVEGEIRVPNVVVNGIVIGDVHASERVQLAENARVTGNVYYRLIEMEMGAEVNGALVHIEDDVATRLTLGHEPPAGEALALDEPAADGESADDGVLGEAGRR